MTRRLKSYLPTRGCGVLGSSQGASAITQQTLVGHVLEKLDSWNLCGATIKVDLSRAYPSLAALEIQRMMAHFQVSAALAAVLLPESVAQRLLPRLRQEELKDVALLAGVPEPPPPPPLPERFIAEGCVVPRAEPGSRNVDRQQQ